MKKPSLSDLVDRNQKLEKVATAPVSVLMITYDGRRGQVDVSVVGDRLPAERVYWLLEQARKVLQEVEVQERIKAGLETPPVAGTA